MDRDTRCEVEVGFDVPVIACHHHGSHMIDQKQREVDAAPSLRPDVQRLIPEAFPGNKSQSARDLKCDAGKQQRFHGRKAVYQSGIFHYRDMHCGPSECEEVVGQMQKQEYGNQDTADPMEFSGRGKHAGWIIRTARFAGRCGMV